MRFFGVVPLGARGDPGSCRGFAGICSMASLADEWIEQRQVCIEVLCAADFADIQPRREVHR